MAEGEKAFETTVGVARLLRISEVRVRQLEREGKLPATRTSTGQRIFLREDVLRLARERAGK